MMTRRFALAALLLAIASAGCGKELVVGGQKHVEATGTGDGTPEGGASGSRAPSYDRLDAVPSLAAAAGRAQGTITFDATVEVGTWAGGYVPLTPAPATVTVKIDGSDTVHIAAGDVPPGRYSHVRVNFTRIQANVTGGLVIGGTNVTGLLTVPLPPGTDVLVETGSADLGSPSASAHVLVDLDASAWLGTADPTTRLISPTAVATALKLRTY
jgi:hypothetical protein